MANMVLERGKAALQNELVEARKKYEGQIAALTASLEQEQTKNAALKAILDADPHAAIQREFHEEVRRLEVRIDTLFQRAMRAEMTEAQLDGEDLTVAQLRNLAFYSNKLKSHLRDLDAVLARFSEMDGSRTPAR